MVVKKTNRRIPLGLAEACLRALPRPKAGARKIPECLPVRTHEQKAAGPWPAPASYLSPLKPQVSLPLVTPTFRVVGEMVMPAVLPSLATVA